jgi:hypothetical protein
MDKKSFPIKAIDGGYVMYKIFNFVKKGQPYLTSGGKELISSCVEEGLALHP